MPKTVDIRRHCKVGLRVCNNLPQLPKTKMSGGGCGRLSNALKSQPYLAAFLYLQFLAQCHPYILLHFTLVQLALGIGNDTLRELSYVSRTRSTKHARAHALVKLRMCEVKLVTRKLLELIKSPCEGTNCLFVSKDSVRTVVNRPRQCCARSFKEEVTSQVEVLRLHNVT